MSRPRPASIFIAVMLSVAPLASLSPAVAQPGCGSAARPPCGASEPAPVAAPTRDQLIAGQWRLFSPVFAAQPAGGYPIRFSGDGTVQTRNLAMVAGWTMPASGHLELTGAGSVIYGFAWSDQYSAFRRIDAEGVKFSLSMVIVPAGLDTMRVAAAMQRQAADRDPAAPPSLLRQPAPLPGHLEGAKISGPGQAVRVAVDAYVARAGGERSTQSALAISAASLGFDVPDFGRAGDRVWEVRVHDRGALGAVIWVNAETGATHFVTR